MTTHAALFAVILALTAIFSATAADAEAVKLTQEAKTIKIEIGGQPFSTYYFADGRGMDFVRPFFYPVLAKDGTEITTDQFGQRDHPHHRSLWVSHGDVNGADHWSLKYGAEMPKQRHLSFTKVEGGTFEELLEWEDKEHKPMMKETRTVRIFAWPDGSRGVDLSSVYTAIADKVTFGDTKEAGLCSARVVKAIADTAVLTNAAGGNGEKECWGKPAVWCDISGTINGKPYGLAMLDHPGNPRHPSHWHARKYGLMGANIFGLSNFDKTLPKGSGAFTIEKDKPVTFRYRVVIHTGDAKAADLDGKFKEFSGGK